MLLSLLLLGTCLASQDPSPEDDEGGQEKVEGVERVFLQRGKNRAPLVMEMWLNAPDPSTPLLVLYHEARSSRGEYRPILPRLRQLGYNALAVDLSFGLACRDVKNATARLTLRHGKQADYLDALPDMLDSLLWAREHHAHGKLVAWGSAFSASLAIVMAAEHADLVDGVIAFSPGEYFTSVKKSATWIQETAKSVACPVLIGSARSEAADWKPIFGALASATKVGFLPEGEGAHGSSALWDEKPDHAEYWAAVEAFLAAHFPLPAPRAGEGK